MNASTTDNDENATPSKGGGSIELSYIRKVIRLVEHSDVDEVEIEENGRRIRVARHRNAPASIQVPVAAHAPVAAPAPVPASAPAAAAPASAPEKKYHEIRSPIVGTFYRAPAPDAESYVEIGQQVRVGSVLCIVEAMKLMNEIESDSDGTIVKILAENGKPVEYNQVLFLVDKG